MSLIGTPGRLERLDDHPRAEGSRLDQRPVDLREPWSQAWRRATGRSGRRRPGSTGCRSTSRAPADPDSPGPQPRRLAPEDRRGRPCRPRRRPSDTRAARRCSTNQAKMSPTADCPASKPNMPGRMPSSTTPHMPSTSGRTAAQDQVADARAHDRHHPSGLGHGHGRHGHVRIDVGDRDRRSRPQARPGRRLARSARRRVGRSAMISRDILSSTTDAKRGSSPAK